MLIFRLMAPPASLLPLMAAAMLRVAPVFRFMLPPLFRRYALCATPATASLRHFIIFAYAPPPDFAFICITLRRRFHDAMIRRFDCRPAAPLPPLFSLITDYAFAACRRFVTLSLPLRC